jgi:hypothetical protein
LKSEEAFDSKEDTMATQQESTGAPVTEKIGDVQVVQAVHQDGTVDYVDTHAIGGDLDAMPPGYFHSIQFIGTVIVSTSLSTPASMEC